MILALLACACPSFDEMEIVAADMSATDDHVAIVRQALADFAAWTGDDGVCVPEIRLQGDLAEPIGLEDAGELGGQYAGDHYPIRLDADLGGLRRTTLHELCHATDRREGHRDAIAWPEVADRSWFRGPDAVGEDFAEACEAGPIDVTLDAALVAACGTAPVFEESAYYLADVVFPNAGSAWSDAPYAYTEVATPWEGLPYGVGIYDARVVGSEVLLLVYAELDVYIIAFDTTLTGWRWQARIVEGVFPPYTLKFVGADVGTYVALGVYGEEDVIFEVGGRTIGTGAEWVKDPMAIAGGILYSARNGTLVATTLDGEPVTLEPPGQVFRRSLDVAALWPEGDGVAFYVPEGLGRYNAEDSSWSVEPAIGEVAARVDLGDGRALVTVSGTPARWFVYESGAYAFLGDPCAESSPDIGDVYLQFGVEGRLVWFDVEASEEGWLLVRKEAVLQPE